MNLKLKRQPLTISFGAALGLLGLGLFLGLAALAVSHEMLLFKSMPMNGAFQLYNPLHRLAAGGLLGRDFDFFHGPGTLLLHYPVFALAGGDLLASELSRNLMGLLAFLVCFHLCAAAWRIPGYIAALAACGTLVVGEALLHGSGALCGNSMVGLRSTLPAVVLPAMVLLARNFKVCAQPAVFHPLVGIGLGGAVFVATEQGLAAIGVYGLLLLVFPLSARRPLARAGWAVVAGVTAIITYLICLAAVAGGRPTELLRYALLDLPQEQFWYFGAPPNEVPVFPGMLRNGLIIVGVWLPLMLAGGEIIRLRARPAGLREIPVDSVLVLLLLGLALVAQIPQLASYSHYHNVATRNMGLVGMLWIFRWGHQIHLHGKPLLARLTPMRISLLATALLLLLPVLGCSGVARYLHGKRQAKASAVSYCGMPLSQGWASDLAAWQQVGFSGAKVAASYRALIEDRHGSSFRGPDYIIHALGSRRTRFLGNLKSYDPDFFLTINPDFSQYEEWLQLRHWDVYRHLIQHYVPVQASEFHVFWRRQADAFQGLSANPETLQAVPAGKSWLSPENTGERCAYTVSVRYAIDNPFGAIPVAGKLTRYLLARETSSGAGITTQIPASLPPTESMWEFPIILGHGEHARFTLNTIMTLPGCAARIQSITLVEITRDTRVIKALAADGRLAIHDNPGTPSTISIE